MTRSPRPGRSSSRPSNDPDATAPVRAVGAAGAPPRSGKTPPRARRDERKASRWRMVRRALLALTAFGVLALIGVAFVLAQVPLPAADPPVETTFIYDANGALLAQLNAGENRVSKDLGEMSPHLVDAVLAAEDKDFFTHNGIDAKSIARALLADLRGQPLQGGSTITQQYVKITYTEREKTLMRKLKEATLAVKLERQFDKAEILERYLNTIYFGRGAYGAEAASRAYFGPDVGVADLSEPQAAYLAGLIRAPEVADANRADAPDQAEVAERRRNIVLRAMEEQGHLTEDQVQAFAAQPVAEGVLPRDQAVTDKITGAEFGTEYFVKQVKKELMEEHGYSEDRINGGGLQIHTTLDLRMQMIGYDSVYGPNGVAREANTSGALVSIDANGHVKAMIGGRGFAESQVNYATGIDGGGSGRQVGSTFKPFVLAELVRQGFSVESMINSPGTTEFPEYTENGVPIPVSNYDTTSHGRIPITRATAVSSNTAYVRMGLDLGVDRVVATARDLGVEAEVPVEPSVVLGSAGIPVVDMADAYLTFATRGEQVDPIYVTRIADADGNDIQSYTARRERVLTEEQADIVNAVLQGVVERGSGDRADFGRPVAGKTGTTSDNVDAWFVGYTPGLATAVWMGNPAGNVPMEQKVTGGTIPADMFKSFMERVVTDESYGGDFVEPDDLGVGKPFGGRENAPAPPTTAPRRSPTTRATPDTTEPTLPPSTTVPPTTTSSTVRPRNTTTSSPPTTGPGSPPPTRPGRPEPEPDPGELPDFSLDPAGVGPGQE